MRRSAAASGYFNRERFDVAHLDVLRQIDAGPFGARAKEPALLAGDARGVKRGAGNEERCTSSPPGTFGPTTTSSLVPPSCSRSTSIGSPR
jgi:hypothetical protein